MSDLPARFHQQIVARPWLVLPLAIVAVALFAAFTWWLQRSLIFPVWPAVILLGVLGGGLIWLGFGWFAKQLTRQAQTEAELRTAHAQLAETHRQLLAVHDIGREIATASDMQQVLNLAARAPGHLTGAMGATVVSFDTEHNRLNLDMAWGLSESYLSGLTQRIETGLSSEKCSRCDPLTARVTDNCPLFDGLETLARQEGIRSLICLPLTTNRKREGIINAYFPSPDGPPEEQIQLLNIVATEIAAALDGARLRSNQMATLYAVEHLADNEQNLEDLLHQILDTTLVGWSAHQGAILLYDQQSNAWHHHTRRGPGDSLPGNAAVEAALNLAEQVKAGRHPVFNPVSDQNLYAAAAPLLAGQKFIGALVMLSDRSDLFQSGQAPLLSAVAHQAALAIDNAMLHAEVQHMAVLEERYRLSREIHDGLAQTLSLLGWQLDHIKKLQHGGVSSDGIDNELTVCRHMVREAYMDVREAIDGLRLQSELSGSLTRILQEYLADFQERTGISALLETRVNPQPAETELQLQRIVQEALTNVRKHAQAQNVWVKLQQSDDRLSLTIADDGQGFDPSLPRGRKHVGLSSMRERAESLDGDISLVTGHNQGTRITVTLPVKQPANH